MSKPTVRYHKDKGVRFLRWDNEKGGLDSIAYLWPIDHYSGLVSNTKEIQTSLVVSHDLGTGRIETQNTVYIPE